MRGALDIGLAALAGGAVVAAGFAGLALASHPQRVLAHQNDPSYVPVMVWQPGLGTTLEYKPASGYWVCMANAEAEGTPEAMCNHITPDMEVDG